MSGNAPRSPEPSLTGRVVKAGWWSLATALAAQGLHFARVLVLAYLLAPAQFGLFGMALLAVATLNMFTRTGVEVALVQRRRDAESYLDSAWTMQLMRDCLLALVLLAGAPAVAWFFREPDVVLLLRVMAGSVALAGFTNIGVVYFRKDLQFHKHFLLEVGSAVISLAVGVALAYRLRSVWALVWSRYAGIGARCALSYLLHPHRPAFRFDGAQMRELFRFGRWVLLSYAGLLLLTQGDDMVVGKLLGAGALGLYQMAYRVSNLAAAEVSHTISRVVFPAYCKVSEDRGRLAAAYLRVARVVLCLVVPLSAGIALFIGPLTRILLHERWAGIIVPAQVLALWGLRRAYAVTTDNVFISIGRPNLSTVLLWARVLILAVIVYPMTRALGTTGTALAVVACAVPVDVVAAVLVKRLLGLRWRELLGLWTAPLLAGLVAAAAVLLAWFAAGMAPVSVSRVFVLAGLFCAVYAAAVWQVDLLGGSPLRAEIIRVFRLPTARTEGGCDGA